MNIIAHGVNGLAIGSVYALLALGFTLVFGVANLINFAQGSLFMVGAYIAWSAAHLWALPFPVAALIAFVVSAALGVVIDIFAIRPLRGGPRIAPLLSTLAVSVMLDKGAELVWGPDPRRFPSPISGRVIDLGAGYISLSDATTLAVGVATMALLAVALRRSWAGRAIRASAQDEEAALQMGVPVWRMRTIVFGLAGGLGAVGGVMAGMYYQSIFPAMGLPFAIKGFTAAILGGIASVPGAIIGGLSLGVLESVTGGIIGMGYRDLVSFAVLLLLVVFRPQGLLGSRKLDALGGQQAAAGAMPTTSPLAAASNEARPRVLQLRPGWYVLIAAGVAVLPLVLGAYPLRVATMALVYALLAISLTLVSGTAGRISLAHIGFWGVGAYVTGILLRSLELPLPAEVTLLLSGLVAALVAWVAAAPLTKLSGITVIFGTLAVGEVLRLVFLTWSPVTRGPLGILGITRPRLALLGGVSLSMSGLFWLTLVIVCAATIVSQRMQRSTVGVAWRALREDVVAARVSGVPAGRYLNLAFAVGGFFAGISGALYAHVLSVIHPDSFQVVYSIELLTMAVVGGLGNAAGAVLGGVALSALPEVLRGFAEYRLIVYGLVLLLTIRFRPRGIGGIV